MRPNRSSLGRPASACSGGSAGGSPSTTPWVTLDPTAASKVDASEVEDAAPTAVEGTIYSYTVDTSVVVTDPAAMLRYEATVVLDWSAPQVVELELDAPDHPTKSVIAGYLAADSTLDAGVWFGVSRESAGASYDVWVRSTDVNVPAVGGSNGPLKVRAVVFLNGDGRYHARIEVYDRATGDWRVGHDQDVVDAGLTGGTAVIGVCLGQRGVAGAPGSVIPGGLRYRLHG